MSERGFAGVAAGDTPLHLDQTGARPIDPDETWTHPQPAQKIVARHLTSYLAHATPSLELDTAP